MRAIVEGDMAVLRSDRCWAERFLLSSCHTRIGLIVEVKNLVIDILLQPDGGIGQLQPEETVFASLNGTVALGSSRCPSSRFESMRNDAKPIAACHSHRNQKRKVGGVGQPEKGP